MAKVKGTGAAKYLALFEDEVAVQATFDVSSLWAKMIDAYLAEVMDFSRGSPTPDELYRHMVEFMDALSDKPVEAIARESTSVAYNEGRSAAMLTSAESGESQYVMRSEILDNNTCDSCAALDGEIFDIGSDEYFANMPPSQCEGGGNCRGLYVIVPAA